MQNLFKDLDDFTFNCKVRNLSDKTIRSYEQTLTLFIMYLEREKEITKTKDVTQKHIVEYMDYLKVRGKYTVVSDNFSSTINNPEARNDYNKKVTDTTINNYIRNIKVFFNWSFSEKLIKKDIVKDIKLKKVDRKPKEFIEDIEFKRLLNSLDISKYPEFRDYTVINLLLDTGMRIGETLALTEDDFDFKHNTIDLRADITKGKSHRQVYYSNNMAQILKRWLNFRDKFINSEYFFCTLRGTQLDIRNFEKNLTKYGKRIELDITPHQLRNNFAKRFLMNGGNIYSLSKILGHSSVEVTEQAYLDLTDADIRKTYLHFSPLANMKR